MELPHYSHDVHFIQAIKGGLVTKELNVTRERPTVSYKQIRDIYDDVKANDNRYMLINPIDILHFLFKINYII
ncbi:hypothetical protein Lalb_Chr19g0125051 [Lupinus albus]|uniref:Uncharacterized protein n=1 Tax=Lupinus albus TaxID=3870 RepID=A0A6A4NS93_LUPAL|nr:hypothetical protein Lalb_Chr19g0125051 [Lupinus albus]